MLPESSEPFVSLFGKSWDRFCASPLKSILVVADSHSNKEEQPDASSNLPPTLCRSGYQPRQGRCDSSSSRRDFPTILVLGEVSWRAGQIGRHGVNPCPMADWLQLSKHTHFSLTDKIDALVLLKPALLPQGPVGFTDPCGFKSRPRHHSSPRPSVASTCLYPVAKFSNTTLMAWWRPACNAV
ncbi:MAG: hypothetical protein SLRJCFUN_000766 [Candidatus Fervidibacter sp.]